MKNLPIFVWGGAKIILAGRKVIFLFEIFFLENFFRIFFESFFEFFVAGGKLFREVQKLFCEVQKFLSEGKTCPTH